MITKPSYLESDIWANDQVEGINIINPDNAYKSTGWIYGQKPPYTVMNWIQNTNSEMLVHINQNGIAQWDILTNYNQNAYVNYNDKIYIANAATVGVAPDASADWGEDLALTPDNLIITAEDPRTDGASKIVQTGANGLIDISLMPIGGMTYIGNYDMTATAPSPVDTGDFVTALADGVIDASWTGIGGTNAHASQSFIWDGAAWNAMAADTDLMGQYLRRDGLDIGMTGPLKVGQADTDNHAVTLYGDTTIGSAANPRIFTVNGAEMKTSELERIDEGNGDGWRLVGADTNNHGNIGLHAIDLTTQDVAGDFGVLGENSFAHGWGSTVSGRSSLASGWENKVLGDAAFATGYNNTAAGYYSFVSGEENFVHVGGFAAGGYSKAIGADRVLEVLSVSGQEVTVVSSGLSHIGNVIITSPEADPRDISDIYSYKVTAKAGDHFTVEGDATLILPGMKVYDVFGGSYVLGTESVAAGYFSSAFGVYTLATNQAQTVLGEYNVGTSLNTKFEVGVGDSGAHANALEVYKNGRIVAPELTEVMIDLDDDSGDIGVGPQTLTTRDYVTNKIADVTAGTADITYDNAISGLTAVTLKTAIDEVAAEVAGNGWPTEDDFVGDGVQDTFQPAGGYVVGKVTVFSDGVKLRNDVTEYTATDGINVVLTQVPDLDTWINVVYLQA